MNKKIIVGIAIAAVFVLSIGVVDSLTTTVGDESVVLTGEEGMEKTLNIQEINEQGESAAAEAREYGGG